MPSASVTRNFLDTRCTGNLTQLPRAPWAMPFGKAGCIATGTTPTTELETPHALGPLTNLKSSSMSGHLLREARQRWSSELRVAASSSSPQLLDLGEPPVILEDFVGFPRPPIHELVAINNAESAL